MRYFLSAAFAVLLIACPAIAQSAVDPAPAVPAMTAPTATTTLPAAAPATVPTTVPAGTPVTVTTTAPVDTTVSIPIGAWANTALGYLTLGLGGFIVWGFRKLPPQIYALAMTMRADQLLGKAMLFALHSVAGTVEGKVITVDVRNKVLKEFVTYVLVHGASQVKAFIGNPADIAEKGWARLEIPQEGSKPDFVEIGNEATAAANIKGVQTP